MRQPVYFGGMILSDLDTAYQYENHLADMLQKRWEKYSKKWSFLVGMLVIARTREYSEDDFHPIPEDSLTYIPDEPVHFFLNLKRKKLIMLEFEVLKYYRRKKHYPT